MHDNNGVTFGGISRQDSLVGPVHGRPVECLKHDLDHALAVGLWVEGSLSGPVDVVVDAPVQVNVLKVFTSWRRSLRDGRPSCGVCPPVNSPVENLK